MLTHLMVQAQLKKQRGLTSVEYAVAGGLVVAGIVLALTFFGTALTAAIQDMLGKM
jgi:Flp pilus assembly pilin Flp